MRILIFTLCFISCFALRADEPAREKIFLLQSGVSLFDFDEFNANMGKNGFPKVNETRFHFGFLFRLPLREKHLLEIDSNFMFKNDEKSGARVVSSSGVTILLNYLYKRKDFYGVFGVGAGTASIVTSNAAQTTFDNAINSPVSTNLNRTTALANLGLAYEKPFSFKNRSFSWGVRLGYLFSFLESDWRNPFEEVSAGPDYDFSGPYLKFSFGLF